MTKPFGRSLAIAAMVAQAMSAAPTLREFLLRQIPEYTSRGKGRGKFSGLATNARQTTFTVPLGGGKREVARRSQQLALRQFKLDKAAVKAGAIV